MSRLLLTEIFWTSGLICAAYNTFVELVMHVALNVSKSLNSV